MLSASTYLAQALDPTIAIIMFFTVASYMPVTILITEWRGQLRREVNRTDQVQGESGYNTREGLGKAERSGLQISLLTVRWH